MTLIQFFVRESGVSLRAIIVMSLVSALGNTLVLYAINETAETVFNNRGSPWQLFFIYLLSLGLFYVGRKYALTRLIQGLEIALLRVRKRIAEDLENTELQYLEQVGKARLFDNLISNTNLVSKSAVFLGSALQSAITVLFAFAYIGLLSIDAFLLSLVAVAIGATLYRGHHRYVLRQQAEVESQERAFFTGFEHLLGGFKEIKLNEPKARDLLDQLSRISDASGEVKLDTGMAAARHVMFVRTLLNILIGVLAFGLPVFTDLPADVLVKVIATILFVSASFDYVVNALPTFDSMEAAVKGLYTLEADLKAARHQEDHDRPLEPLSGFERIDLRDLRFRYLDPEDRRPLFELGPLNLSIQRGETLFIVGGNGSGKSTFMKLLTGLYYPDAGEIRLDGRPVDGDDYRAFRSLFSVIFSDFHLFDRLYGQGDVDPERVDELLRLMQLEDKTQYQDGRFTHQELSTGQKKRLALIVAMMENRPVFIFDEWAADQDPGFRRYFYEVLLRRFKKEGKTIIAVTHDDRYFGLADRIVALEQGRIVGPGGE